MHNKGMTIKARLLKFSFRAFIPLLLLHNLDRNTAPVPPQSSVPLVGAGDHTGPLFSKAIN